MSLIILVIGVLALMLLFWVLKVAFKLILVGIVVVVAIAAFTAVRDRIGGPR